MQLDKYFVMIAAKKIQDNSFRLTKWQFKNRFKCAFASVPFLFTCAVLLTFISLKSPALLFCLIIGTLGIVVIQQVGEYLHLPKSWLMLLQGLFVATILSFFWIDYFANPAAAQFFGKAEKFFNNTLTNGSQGNTTTAVSLVFNVIRALYLLYIAIALVGVVNAVRKDEDWQVVARTPLLVVIAVTIADVLTSFITG